ncbi:DNA-binding transcriptional regulator, GntR family [Lentibacillus halodurans]|uniref:DNA-binding transcriptional regulator, GntR family n=1 Tax=Lentibacillus halodurans TaxID=237679 RepID=A0A1I0W5I4_9BACI|nr:GntR family transcriptional regulator [Lentibacillus halodurans]SFA83607.1 DNA-binding transcriptional regulator, GntR family [Lentibacillus halodurans]
MGKQSIKAYVYQTLKNAIYEQKLLPGQKLIENDISNSLSISRTPIRQAFAQLQKEGFLTLLPYKGAQVINPSEDEIDEAFIHRKQLELLATQTIMTIITPNDIARLNELVQLERETYKQKDLVTYIEVNKEFHYILIKGCNNRFLKNHTLNMINQTHIYLALYDHFYHINEKKDIRGPNEHQMLIEFLEQKEMKGFSQLLDKHISTTIDEYKGRINQFHQPSDLFS